MHMIHFRKFNPTESAQYLENISTHDTLYYMDESDDYSLWTLEESIKVTPAIKHLIRSCDEERPLIVYFVPGLKTVSVHYVGNSKAGIYVMEITKEGDVIHVYSRDFDAERQQRRIDSLLKHKKEGEMNPFEQAQKQYPELMKLGSELNFNTAYLWAESTLKKGAKRSHAHAIKDFLHRTLHVYVFRDQMVAILLMLGFKEEPEDWLNSFNFMVDKEQDKMMGWYDVLRSIENDHRRYSSLTPSQKRHVNIIMYREYIKYRDSLGPFLESKIYKEYRGEYAVYFKP